MFPALAYDVSGRANAVRTTGTMNMARLIRSLVVVGTIAILSPVHQGAALRQDAALHSRSLLATLMPPGDVQKIESAAKAASQLSRQISQLDPQTRDMLLQLAASQLGRDIHAGPSAMASAAAARIALSQAPQP